jgi:mannose-1-phosphate guanylyltransferase
MTAPVFLLAAGLGSRLRPLTDWLPKPLLPVGDAPALAHILARVRPIAGTVVANAHHRIADLRPFLAASDILLSEEPTLLGTAGGLAHAAALLGPGAVLVWNGDIFSRLDPARLLAAHAPDAAATLAVHPRACGEGNVGTDRDGRVVRLRKETVASGEILGGEFLGIHVVGEDLRRGLPREGCLVGDVYLPALRAGQTLRTFEVDVPWHDIGTLADYEAANIEWLRQQGAGSFIGDGAVVAPGVTLRDCVVGAGAHVDGDGVLERCIVWPGARVSAPELSVVATPWGVVGRGASA